MRRKDIPMMREKGLPYSFDYVLERTPIGLKLYEIFDGKEVKWGVREDFISIYDDNLYLSTPSFENLVDENGKDKERIIYLPNYDFVIHGKLNDSEVLCRVNKTATSENEFYKIEDFGGKDVKIYENDKINAFVGFNGDFGIRKCMYFNYKTFKPSSNVFDYIDITNFFLKSYVVGDNKIRLFFGQLADNGIEVKPYGYDVSKHEYFKFPLTDDGLIDENEMKKYIEKDDFVDFNEADLYRVFQNALNKTMDIGAYGILLRPVIERLNKEKTKCL